MKRLWLLGRRYFFEVAVVFAATGGVVEMVFASKSFDAEAPDAPLPMLISAVLLMTLPLLARRRFPFAAPAATVIAASAFSFVEGEFIPFSGVAFLTFVVATFLFGLVRDRRQAAAGLALAYATMIVVHWNEPDGALGDVAFVAIILSLVWLAGLALGSKLAAGAEAEERAARLEREREERARAAVAEERARIARELHDVVGHSVSVMTVQAGGVRRLLKPDQEREREALLVVERTGREALAEMRRMVGVLRYPDEAPALAPQPGVEQLEQLVARAREAGLPVALRVEGEPAPLPAGIDLAAYRAVQEGLTNARKHADAERVEVVIRYGDDRVDLRVTDDGRAQVSADDDGGGHGLVGMRERIALYGGVLDAGPRPGGGYELRVSLPVSAQA